MTDSPQPTPAVEARAGPAAARPSRARPARARAAPEVGVRQPTLSICVPTYERPATLERALHSLIDDCDSVADRLEIIVSDNAPDVGEPVFRAVTSGRRDVNARYLPHRPSLGAVANFNCCLAEATGRYVLLVHDDDYLLPGAVSRLVERLEQPDAPGVLVFGVRVVDASGHEMRSQTFGRETRLSPAVAMRRLLTNSSFVRIPGLVVRRDVFDEVGVFDPAVGNPTDFDLLVRLFARYGATCVPMTTAAYTVHAEASTSSMFHAGMVETLFTIFDRAVATGVLPEPVVRQCQTDWFHQWILGGTYRYLRADDRDGARGVMALFDMPRIRDLGPSRRWAPIRAAFSVSLYVPGPVTRVGTRLGKRFERLVWPSW